MNEKNFLKKLSTLTEVDLISLRVLIEKEMALRNISIDVGDIGEKIAIDYFHSTAGLPNLSRAQKGSKNVDALSRDGERYSIKTIKKAKKTGTVYPDKSIPGKQLFENILLVCLNSQYKLESLYSFSWDAFLKVRAWDKRMNAWYIPVSKTRLALGKKLFPIRK